jgi:hypothetical protein
VSSNPLPLFCLNPKWIPALGLLTVTRRRLPDPPNAPKLAIEEDKYQVHLIFGVQLLFNFATTQGHGVAENPVNDAEE